MKQLIYGLIMGTIAFLTIGIVMTVNGKTTRQSEIDNSLSISVQNAVETTMNEKSYSIENNEEFLADFSQNLLMQISSDSDIEVKVACVDYEKGLLSLKVTEIFTHPNGNEGKCECETTVIFEAVPTTAELVTITYKTDAESIYKEYQITKGDDIIVPKNPQMDGKTFVGWKDASGNIVNITGNANENMTYEAVWQ